MKIYLILGICRTWRCENVMSYWKHQRTIPYVMYVCTPANWLLLIRIQCAPIFMVSFVWFILSFRRDIRNLWQYSRKMKSKHDFNGHRHRKCQTSSALLLLLLLLLLLSSTLKMNEWTNERRPWCANCMSLCVNSVHLLMTIEESRHRKNTFKSPALSNKSGKWIEIMQFNEIYAVPLIFSLWHFFCLHCENEIGWNFFASFFGLFVQYFFHSICCQNGKLRQSVRFVFSLRNDKQLKYSRMEWWWWSFVSKERNAENYYLATISSAHFFWQKTKQIKWN